MSVTYTEDRATPLNEETFVPVYARRGKTARKSSGGKVKTWMILAPIGAVIVGGAAVLMLMPRGEEVSEAALVEPAATAPVLPATAAPVETATAPLTPPVAAPVEATPAPAARETAPAPVRRAAPVPVRRAEPAVAPTPRVEAPVEPAGPQPYTAATTRLNTTPATPAPAAREPSIQVQPLN